MLGVFLVMWTYVLTAGAAVLHTPISSSISSCLHLALDPDVLGCRIVLLLLLTAVVTACRSCGISTTEVPPNRRENQKKNQKMASDWQLDQRDMRWK